MTSFRKILIRGSILLNAALVVYVCVSWSSISTSKKVFTNELEQLSVQFNELQKSPSMRHTFQEEEEYKNTFVNEADIIPRTVDEPVRVKDGSIKTTGLLDYVPNPEPANDQIGTEQRPELKETTGERDGVYQEPPREVQESAGLTEPAMPIAPLVEEVPDPPLDSMERKMYSDLRDCHTKQLRQYTIQKGDYWIFNNYIPSAMNFRCDESITYATHGDYTFLDNLDPLTSRWQGPVSVSVYAPGTDFGDTIDTILYLRNCMAEGVKKYVTFHLFFHANHVPKQIPTTEQLLQRKTDCVKDPPKWTNVTTYRRAKKLLYPVNVARNTARENSQTYFNFPSDVELYPSINFIPDFFKMLKKPDPSNTTNPRVFVFPIFEVSENHSPPETKAELQAMLKKKIAIPFHKKICPKCHNQPKSNEWTNAKPKSNMSVFYVGKRIAPFHKWEPIYIGTNKEPIYDERLSWEGQSDKMTQMYILCVRDYEFHILDNAFLVHRPGIKSFHKNPERDKIVSKQNILLRKKITPEYKILFGYKKGCVL